MPPAGPAADAAPAANAARRTARRRAAGKGRKSCEKELQARFRQAGARGEVGSGRQGRGGLSPGAGYECGVEDGADPKAVMRDVPKARTAARSVSKKLDLTEYDICVCVSS